MNLALWSTWFHIEGKKKKQPHTPGEISYGIKDLVLFFFSHHSVLEHSGSDGEMLRSRCDKAVTPGVFL